MKKPRFLVFATGFTLLLLFVVFSYLVHKDVFTQFDFNTTVRLQDHISHKFDTLFSAFSLIGSVEVTSLILLILFLLKRKLAFIFVFINFGLAHLIELFGKTFVVHPGPPYLFFRYDIDFLFPSSYVQPGSSYPSGHALRTAFISVLIIAYILSSKRFKFYQKSVLISAILIFDVIMFVSRVYLGEHWTSDVIGGSILGVVAGIISSGFLPLF